MITDSVHAQQVQTRRRESGKKGRSKAVRRWAKSECGTAIDAYSYFMPDSMLAGLKGDFTGCIFLLFMSIWKNFLRTKHFLFPADMA